MSISGDWDEEIQQNDSPLLRNYQKLGHLTIKTKSDIGKVISQSHSILLQNDDQLGQEIGSALRLKKRKIKQVQKESQFSKEAIESYVRNQSQLNLSKDSSEIKGILKQRNSFHSSSSSENISQKHVKFSLEQPKPVHLMLK